MTLDSYYACYRTVLCPTYLVYLALPPSLESSSILRLVGKNSLQSHSISIFRPYVPRKPWGYLPDFKTHPESYPPGLSRATLLSFSWIAAPPCLVPKTLFHTNTLQITPSSKCSVAPQLCLDVSVDCKGPAWLTASMTPSASAPSVPAALVPYPHGWAHHSFCSRSLRALTPSLTRMNRLQCRSSSSLDLFDAAILTSP